MIRQPHHAARLYSRSTWIEPKELAYVSPTGNHWSSRRRAAAVCEDGSVRIVTVGIADTYFSCTAHDSRSRVGAVMVAYDPDTGDEWIEFFRYEQTESEKVE
jgi:hypothetical protein